jgi:hypothetical protein
MRRKLRKIKEWKRVNWPDCGHNIIITPRLCILIIALIILLTAGLSSCTPIPITGGSASKEAVNIIDEMISTPPFEPGEDSLFSEEIQLSKTALFGATPEPDECHLAMAGNPLDVSIPDGTLLYSGEHFVKIWRVRNAGTCVWTKDYSIVWVSADNLGTDETVNFSKEVMPGDIIEITVDMIAPEQSGNYQSNWKICDHDNNCFGLGAKGEVPFWTKIEVRERGTITPSIQPSVTPTSMIFASGRVTISNGDSLDLDNKEVPNVEDFDIVLGQAESGLVLAVLNEAEIAWFGQSVPTESQCQSLLYVSDSISLLDMDTSEVLCYKSSSGSPGYIRFNLIDSVNEQISIEYTTWLAR